MKENHNTIQGQWLKFKSELQKAWGELTDDELEKTKGDLKQIGGLIQRKYGENEERYAKKLSNLLASFKAEDDDAKGAKRSSSVSTSNLKSKNSADAKPKQHH